MRVFDCFLFFNELDLLELRLNELKDVVDIFVLVESTVTFKGEPKDLCFNENRERFSAFLGKIRHVVVEDTPMDGPHIDREYFQRLAIMRALGDVGDGDVIMVCDTDEIVMPSAVEELKGFDGITKLRMRMYYYYMNMYQRSDWDKALALPGSLAGEIKHVNQLRKLKRKPDSLPADCRWRVLDNAGWHFTHVGGADRVREKLRAYAHSGGKYDDMLAEGGIEERLLTGRVPGGLESLHLVRIDDSMPRYVRDNEERFTALGYVKSPWDRIAELESLTERELTRVAESMQQLLQAQRTATKRLKKENEKLRAELAARG